MSRAQGACSQGTPLFRIAQHAGVGGCLAFCQLQSAGVTNTKLCRNVPVIGSWQPLHVSVILVDDGPGDPKEKKNGTAG